MKDKKYTKSITPVDDYKFKLSKELENMAKDELRETESGRQSALESMRTWAQENPRILTCRLDSNFLLRFLRVKKYSVPMAQEAIERYLLLRKTDYGHMFQNVDMKIPNINALLDLGYMFAVPNRDRSGRRTIIYRPGVFNMKSFLNEDMLKMHALVYETVMENEEDQIRGLVHIIDAENLTFAHLTLFTPKEAVRIVKNTEKTLPIRHKEISVINLHPSVKFAVEFGLKIVSEKLKSRIHFYAKLLDSEVLDLTVLPKEYGGTMPMEKMIKSFKKEIASKQELLLSHDKMLVNLDLYSAKAREGAVGALKTPLNCSEKEEPNQMYGLQGSFRKLEVD